MRIGLYVPFSPDQQNTQRQEGLGRYWVMLIKTLQINNNIVIACPPWSEKGVRSYLEEFCVEPENIDFIVPMRSSAVWNLWDFYRKHKAKKKKKERTAKVILLVIDAFINALVKINNVFLLLCLILITFILSICLFPISLILLVFRASVKFIFKTAGSIPTNREGVKSSASRLRFLPDPAVKILMLFITTLVAPDTIERIRIDMARSIVEDIATMHQPVDIWYCPMAFWPEFSDIGGVKAMCFPDIVSSVFSEGFAGHNATENTDRIRDSVKNIDFFITYSEYQRNAILVNYLGKEPSNIIAIDLFVNETLSEIAPVNDFITCVKSHAMKEIARRFLSTLSPYANKTAQEYLNGVLSEYNFSEMRYIFYPTHFRPSKNIMNLIRAYEYLLRKKEVTFKLVLTGDFDSAYGVYDYICDNGLQYDVLSFHRVSNQQLSALYACAELTVNTTLFEGGFPMTFCEGMAVGTPSILSRIPQVQERMDSYGLDDCMFDPFDYIDIAEKILYCIENREDIVSRQQLLYHILSARSENTACVEYERAFQYFINKSIQRSSDN